MQKVDDVQEIETSSAFAFASIKIGALQPVEIEVE